MSNKRSINTHLKNYSGSIDVNVARHIKISNAFSKDLVCEAPKHHAFQFDELVFEDLCPGEEWVKDYIDSPDTFGINYNSFRSDEFKKEHEGKHILFSGCSISYGTGLYAKETWPYLLYSKIKEKETLSGYYNISVPANSIFDNVINIFKYIDNYSKPDVIFLNLPDIARFYTLLENVEYNSVDWKDRVSFKKEDGFDYFKDKYFHSLCHYDKNIDSAVIYEKLIYIFQYLLMLEVFCKANNIELYMYSWSHVTNDFLKNSCVEINSFYNIPRPSANLIHDYKIKNKKDKFYLIARDGIHDGTAYHDFWSKEIYNVYMKGKHAN